jgi:OmcA/MtrC family decaheme c-type cytochrome
MPHSIATGSPQVTVTAVQEVVPPDVPAGELRLQVDFRITDSVTGALVTGIPAGNIRFALAKLIPAAAGNSSMWQSYINRTRSGTAGTYNQATTETATTSTLTDNSNGTYKFRFSFNMNTVTTPVAVSYDRTATHRIATQVSDLAGKINVDNAFADFVPSAIPVGGQITAPFPAVAVNRKIATNTTCNQCHVRLGFHGGGRIRVEYCVTCHNPGSTDPTSGGTVDLKVMVHKIHEGENLPSVEAGGSYTVASADYSTVVYPQDSRNCTKCHANSTATPQGDNWKNVPTKEACGSCHDRTSFVAPAPAGYTLHSGGTPVDNTGCAGCHNPGKSADVVVAHAIPEQVATAKFKYNIISITNTAPGQFPTVQFSVTDPSNANAPYNILTAKEFNSGSATTLSILISWPTKDYTNTGSLRTPAQPISINPRVGAVNNGANVFTVASTVPIPAGVTGSGAVAIEGHPAVQSVPGGAYDVRVPVTGVVQSFKITDAAAQNRRTVVDIAKCNQCHGLLSLHGANRNNNTQLCVICHNANATDINRRPVSGVGTDGKAEEAIDFKSMIHGIHAAKGGTGFDGFRTNGLVVYGFGGSVNDFSEVRVPTGAGGSGPNKHLNIKNCLGCHNAGTFGSPINANALPTTINTGSDKSSPDDDVNITPTASVCSSCHDDTASKTHMTANGGRFDYKAYITVVEGGSGGGSDQAALCGPGPVSSQPAGHSSRTDCCSCHSPH